LGFTVDVIFALLPVMDISKKYLNSIKPQLKKPYIPIAILVLVLIGGTLGYYYLWFGKYPTDFIDALYMTIITLTTVGYKEVHELGLEGRIFTMFISVIGIASLFYVFTTIMENLFILQLYQFRRKKKMLKKIDKMENHIIVVGFGRVGQLVSRELLQIHENFVVIDNDFVEEDIFNQKQQLLTIEGDATNDETLLLAGIEKARGMIIATANSAITVFVTLSAKVLNPNLFLVARSDDYSDTEKLERAGADRVVNPYSIGGQRLVSLIINPNIVDFFGTNLKKHANIKIETIILPANSSWCGRTLKDLDIRKMSGATILAIIRAGEPNLNPHPDFKLEKGDQVLAFGTQENIRLLENSALE